jgi:succinoglycan biosynthesis transport protein ExoP
MHAMNDDRLRLSDYLQTLRRRWVSIVAVTALIVAVAVALSLRSDPRYRAEARVLVSTTAAQDRLDPSTGSSNAQTLARRLKNEVEFARSNTVENAANETYGAPFDVTIRTDRESDTLVIEATATTAEDAADRANVYAKTLVEKRVAATADELVAATASLNDRLTAIDVERREIIAEIDTGEDERLFTGRLAALDVEETTLRSSLREVQIAEDLSNAGSASITRIAEPPDEPYAPAWTRNIAFALVIGLTLGAAVALLRETLDGTIRTKKQLEAASGLPTLGLIPSPAGRRGGDATPTLVTTRSDPFVEAVRSLRSSVLFAKTDSGEPIALAFTSPNPAEGKTTTATNLALALARAGQRVVLVDADLRRPRVAETCGLPTDLPGLSEMLSARRPLGTYPEQVTGQQTFAVIPAGREVPHPSELLGSADFAGLVASLRSTFDIVLLDTTPILPVSDGLAVASVADATLLVTQAQKTDERQVRAALELLQRSDAQVIGTVLTNVDRQREYGGNDTYDYG